VLFPVDYQGRALVVVWAPGGDNRPYQAPDDLAQKGSPMQYFVRQGPQTVVAKGEFLRQLMELAAKIPFDDRRNQSATIDDISPPLVHRFLRDIRSSLTEEGTRFDDYELYRRLRITKPMNGREAPTNVGLLFFNESPDRFFASARIEVAQFGDDQGGDLIEERSFRGPLDEQVRQTLEYLNSLGGAMVRKIAGQAEVDRTVAYPYEAMEEAIVNAVYHRSYDAPPDPIKVYLFPDRMEIISYPGPVAGIKRQQFEPDSNVAPAPARNRRIGEFLKELRLAEGRGTGIPKIQRRMRENGSPEARFDFDDDRTYFRTTLPAHPRYQVLHALREASHLWAIGERRKAVDHLQRAFDRQTSSGAIASQLIEYAHALEELDMAQQVLDRFDKQSMKSEGSRPYLTHARLLINRQRPKEAVEILTRMPVMRSVSETVEAAILKKRSADYQGAHQLLAEAYSLNPDDPKILQEYAQTKLRIAAASRNRALKKRLDKEAAELLRRAIQLSTEPGRTAWCWYDLARTLDFLRAPKSEVDSAFLQALLLLPNEPAFIRAYRNWKEKTSSNRG